MYTTLSTALSALNANSTAVSVVGNDLANLNTTGYKTTQIAFQDMMAQTMGGINGLTLGMGTARPQTIRQFGQGSMQSGLGGLNAAIQGQGFFMIKDARGKPLYTRDGTFMTGAGGYLVDAHGSRVQGWTSGPDGTLNTNGTTGDILIPSGTLFPPVASTKVSLSMNLNAAAIAGTTSGVTSGTFSQPIKVFDSLGTAHTLTATFTKPVGSSAPVQVGAAAATQIVTGDTATFTVNTTAGTNTFTITGKDGDTLDSQVTDLNTKLQAYGITASLSSSGNLQFSSDKPFSVSGVAGGDNGPDGTPGTAPANLVGTTAETANNTALNNQALTTAAGTLSIEVGSTTVPVTLTGTSATDLAAINTALTAAGIQDMSAIVDASDGSIQLQGSSTFTVTATPDDAAAPITLGTYTPLDAGSGSAGAGAANTWNYTVTMDASDLASGKTTTVASGTLKFDPKTGQLMTPDSKSGTIMLSTGSGKADKAGALANGAVMNDINWDLYDAKGNPLVTQVDQDSAVSANTADGSAAAQLTQVLMGDGGQLMAQFSNGRAVAIAQLSIANIPNANSMLAVGSNDFETTSQTAAPVIGTAGSGGRGEIVGGALEQSTVDIAQEFSNLITLQNAYQANSRVVTTENQILQQTVNMIQG